MRSVSLLVLPFAAVALLAGCSGSDPQPPATQTVSASPSATASPNATVSPSSTSSASPEIDPTAPDGQCADEVLSVEVTGGDAGAGNIDYEVVFTNSGGADCVLQGAPGVSVVGDSDGTQLGQAATQPTSGSPAAVTVPAGGSVSATLTSVNIAGGGGPLGDQCPVTDGDGYRVYPPHSFRAFFVPSAGVPACTGDTLWLTVLDVQ